MSLLDDIPLSYSTSVDIAQSYAQCIHGNTLLNLKSHIIANLKEQESQKTTGSSDTFNVIDLLTQFVQKLLQYNMVNDDLIVSVLLLSKQYHNQAHELLYQNYTGGDTPDNDQSWKSVSRYFQLSIGLLKFLEVEISPLYAYSAECSRVWNIYYQYNILYSQFSMVILGLYKLKDSLFDNYSQLELNKQTQLQGLSFKMLAKILINIYNTFNNGLSQLNNNFVQFQKKYIYGLIQMFLSLHYFEIENKIGLSCSLIKDSISLLNEDAGKKTVFQQYMKEARDTISHTDKNNKKTMGSTIKEKYLTKKKKFSEKKMFKIGSSSSRNSKQHAAEFKDALLLETFQNFIAPLLYLLEYRYDHFNNTVALEPIITDKQELQKNWPVAMSTPLKYITWKFQPRSALFQPVTQEGSAGNYF